MPAWQKHDSLQLVLCPPMQMHGCVRPTWTKWNGVLFLNTKLYLSGTLQEWHNLAYLLDHPSSDYPAEVTLCLAPLFSTESVQIHGTYTGQTTTALFPLDSRRCIDRRCLSTRDLSDLFPWKACTGSLCISVFLHLQNKTWTGCTRELWYSLSVAICHWLDFH